MKKECIWQDSNKLLEFTTPPHPPHLSSVPKEGCKLKYHCSITISESMLIVHFHSRSETFPFGWTAPRVYQCSFIQSLKRPAKAPCRLRSNEAHRAMYVTGTFHSGAQAAPNGNT
ncbi:hypothetical protein BRADI_2g56711v3 [Brachypodium distachyon]|uniref:Uncharacterized protein n=1 Tax=Brachypodium distachyon TaxID=15368 RepID=A0A2K2DG94_BRADI|nr:hypothetical protein BRADI_2g56711v3 [Brachypodium distachyon]